MIVGAVAVVGSAFFQNDTFTVRGAGADIWGTSDAYPMVESEIVADGSIAARVTAEDGTHPLRGHRDVRMDPR